MADISPLDKLTPEEVQKVYSGDFSPFDKLSPDEITTLYRGQQASPPPSLGARIGSEAVQTGKEFGKGMAEGAADVADTLSPTKMGPEPNISGKTGSELKNYTLPKSQTTAESFNFSPPQDVLGAYSRAAGRASPGAVGAPGGWLGRLFYGPGAGVMGRATGDATASVLGDAAGNKAEALANIFGPGAIAKRVAPFKQTDPLRAQGTRTLEREGVPTTVGTEFGNVAQQERETKSNPALNLQRKEALTRAYSRKVGDEQPLITKGTGGFFDRNHSRIKGDFNNLAANTFADPRVTGNGNFNTQAYNDLHDVEQYARQNNPAIVDDALNVIKGVNSQWTPRLNASGQRVALPGETIHDALFGNAPGPVATQNVQGMAGTRNMTGQQYQRLRSALHEAADQADPSHAYVYRGIADSLDNAVENTLRGINSPLAGQWAKTRGEYKALLTLEDAAKRNPGDTYLDARTMDKADQRISGSRKYLRGDTQFADLINAETRASGAGKKGALAENPNAPGIVRRLFENIPGGRFVANNIPRAVYAATVGAAKLHGAPWSKALEEGVGPLLFAEGGRMGRNVEKLPPTVGANPISQSLARNPAFLPDNQKYRNMGTLLRALQQNNQAKPSEAVQNQ